jgi:NAD(P)-dependent dehydrogenase (short-subunit alcohol dehydrogenase family)
VASLREALAGPHFFAVADVVDDDAVGKFCAAAGEATGAPDLLLNNAALINRPAPLWEVSAAEFSEVIDVNIKGVTNVLRYAVPLMLEARRGVIVNFSSGWGRSTSPEMAPYCATKWAIEGLTQALAQELPEGIAAVALNPGIIDTEMLRSAWGEGAAAYPTPGEWAEAAVPFVEGLSARDNGRAVSV